MRTSPGQRLCVAVLAASILGPTAAVAGEEQAEMGAKPAARAEADQDPASRLIAALRQVPAELNDLSWDLNEDDLAGEDAVTPCATHYPDDELPQRLWVRADYLLWWTKGSRLPPLITASPAGTPPSSAGRLGEATTTVLYGNQYVNDDARSGTRLSTGFWLDSGQTVAIAADYFDLGAATDRGRGDSSSGDIIARPFYNMQAGQQDAQLISGTIGVDYRDYFQSAGSWLQFNLAGCTRLIDDCSVTGSYLAGRRGYDIDLLVGYRYYRADDSLSIRESTVDTSGGPFNGTTFDIAEGFRTENRFHGAELGFSTRVYRGRWSLELLTKMAIGNNRQVVTIDGQTITTLPGLPPTTASGGVLATGSNIGRYTDDQFTVIPQLGLDLGFDLSERLRLFVGYNLIYWPQVQRAADQIDLAVDPRNIPPVQPGALPFPAAQLSSTDFWAQGVNFGLLWQY